MQTAGQLDTLQTSTLQRIHSVLQQMQSHTFSYLKESSKTDERRRSRPLLQRDTSISLMTLQLPVNFPAACVHPSAQIFLRLLRMLT